MDEVLFAEINHQLEAAGLKVNATKGAIVDATIVPSAARPRKRLEMDENDKPPRITAARRRYGVENLATRSGKFSFTNRLNASKRR